MRGRASGIAGGVRAIRRRPWLAAALLLALAACSGSSGVRAPCAAGKVCLEYGNEAEPVSLDPHKEQATWEDRIIGEMLVGLTQDDPTGKPVPAMATRWEASPDGLVWTFHLRDANWSDGVPVTAGDFVFGLRRLLAPATASEYASLMYILKNAQAVNEGRLPGSALGIAALNAHTLQITLAHPAPYLPELAKHQTMYPVPEHVVRKWGDAWTQPEHYVANGPYRLVEWRFGDHIKLIKNDAYYDAKKICIDQVDFYPTTDPLSAERRVRRGELDVNASIQSNRVAYLRQPGQMPDFVRVHTYLGVYYLILNGKDVPPLKDRRVRLALSLAIDRRFITDKLLRAGQIPATNFVPPGVANYRNPPPPAWASWPFERRQAAARALLAQAGYGPSHPLSIELKHFDSPETARIMASVQSDWRAVGIATSLVQAEAQIGYQDFRRRDFQAGLAAWVADYNDAVSFLYLQQSSTGSLNYGDYSNPVYDALLSQADKEPDLVKRGAILAKAEQIMVNDAPVLPLYYALNRNLVNPRITGWVDNIVDWHRLSYLCMKPATP